MDNLFDTKGVELPTRPGVSSLAVITVQGVVGGVPITVAGGGGGGNPPSTATVVTSVPGTVVSTTLLAANPARLGATFYNEGNRPWFIKLGAVASLVSYTVQVPKDSYYEVPFNYVGVITGLQAVALGKLLVTELT